MVGAGRTTTSVRCRPITQCVTLAEPKNAATARAAPAARTAQAGRRGVIITCTPPICVCSGCGCGGQPVLGVWLRRGPLRPLPQLLCIDRHARFPQVVVPGCPVRERWCLLAAPAARRRRGPRPSGPVICLLVHRDRPVLWHRAGLGAQRPGDRLRHSTSQNPIRPHGSSRQARITGDVSRPGDGVWSTPWAVACRCHD